MEISNNFGLPEFVVDALTFSTYSRGDAQISVTQLIDSPQVQMLQRELSNVVSQDVTDLIFLRFGTAMHKLFEQAVTDTGGIAEERMFFKHMDWNISGQIDLQEINIDGATLSDFKVTSAWSVVFGPKVEWVNQLNSYAWLVRHAKNVEVTKLQIIAILRDWNRRKAGNNDYPDSPIQIVDIPLWNVEQQDQYMTDRIRLHQGAEAERLRGGPLPLCTDEERWMKPTTYAVKARTADGKPRKRALRVFDSILEAEEFLHTKDHTHLIETRPGENTRCRNWCLVSQHCAQYQHELREENVSDE